MDGTVADFDERRGLGTIESGDGRFPFHCTAVADGTRAIEVGAKVVFEVRPAGGGRWEATQIDKV